MNKMEKMQNNVDNKIDNQIDNQQVARNLINDIIFLNSLPIAILFIVLFVMNWLGFYFSWDLLSGKWLFIIFIVCWIYFLFSMIYLILRKYSLKVIIFWLFHILWILFVEIIAIILFSLWHNSFYTLIGRETKIINNISKSCEISKQNDEIIIKSLEKKLKTCQTNTWNKIKETKK